MPPGSLFSPLAERHVAGIRLHGLTKENRIRLYFPWSNQRLRRDLRLGSSHNLWAAIFSLMIRIRVLQTGPGTAMSAWLPAIPSNHYSAKIDHLNFHPLEVVSRYRDPQL